MIFYRVLFIISVICTIIYLAKTRKNNDVGMGFIFLLVMTTLLGYLMMGEATTLEGALYGNYIAYIGGCFLQPCLIFVILRLCKIKYPKYLMVIVSTIAFLIYGMVITSNYHSFYYKKVWLDKWRDVTLIQKDYGPGHTIFYVYILLLMFLNIGILVWGIAKQKEASIRNIIYLMSTEIFAVLTYFLQKILHTKLDIAPMAYVLVEIILICIMERLALYSVYDTVAKAMLNTDEMGCMTFSAGRCYIGSDDTAQMWFEELKQIRVDRDIWYYQKIPFLKEVRGWMDVIDNTADEVNEFFYTKNDIIYKIMGSYILDKEADLIEGYQFTISDYTTEKKYIELLESYNNQLAEDVSAKTQHILDMHDRFVRGMADMVEGRDSNTGGHIKRTSEVVRILVEEMMKDEELDLTEKFCDAVIKAAPMHDLGKITVDDAILRKPGKFEPWEFDIMKSHAENGAKIVHKLLADMDDDYFAEIAENVAHYHHERIDGSGYPHKLKGDEIPFEARIMAIADVYDALVSKRCYKDSLSFDKAFSIIEEGMGSQFDERLNKYFVSVREKLENYYSNELNAEPEEDVKCYKENQ